MMVEITCPYCGRKFQIDVEQLIGEEDKRLRPERVEVEITDISPQPKYYTRKKDGKKLPYLPYPPSSNETDQQLNELAEEIMEIVKVTGKINGYTFNAVVWHMRDTYSDIAYVINGRFEKGPLMKRGPMRVKNIKYQHGGEYPLKISPVGYSSTKKKRHKLDDPKEIDEVMRYIGDFVEIGKNGYFVFKENLQSIHNKEFLKKLILVWYAFYARFDIL